MKKTLLEITIDVLNAIDGDEVNSISDTVESLQAAQDIQTVYYDIIGRKDWQFLRKLKRFLSLSDASRPTHLIIPENTSKLDIVNYNKLKENDSRNYYAPVNFLYPDEFLMYVNQRDNTATDYREITDFNGSTFTIRTNVQPTYFTSFDDKYVVMDAYNSAVEDTLQGHHTQVLLFEWPTWEVSDGFIPQLPAEMFPYFIAECLTYAIAKKEGQLIQKTEQTAGRHQRHLSQTHGVVQTGVRLPDYGRRSSKAPSTNRSPLFGPKS